MDIYQCNLKLILGLIWTLILRYQIAGPVVHEAPDDKKSGKKANSKEQKSAKKLLHHWVNVVIPGCKVTNFSQSWNNGLALSALVDYCKPGLIPNHASLDPNNGLENITNAMDIAEKELGVPQVMHPEDMAVEKPDELSVMTYVSGYSHQDSAGQKSLLIWINIQMPHFQVTNLSSDWTDGKALGALTDVLSGGQFPEYEGMSSETPLENCKIVMHKAKEMLEIELLTTPEEFSSLSLNQLTRVSYLAQFQSCKPKSLIDSLEVNGKGVTGDIVNQETTFTVSAQRIPKWADIRANVSTATGKTIQVTKQFQDDKSAKFSYTPEEPGEFVIDIFMNDSPLPQHHATHIIPTFVNNCTASGDGLKRACVGKRAEFTVDCEQGGMGELQVIIQGQNNKLPAVMEKTKPQTFNVHYTPEEVDSHEIAITWGSEQIPESPFQCTVLDPSKCSAKGKGLTDAIINVQHTFVVDTRNAGPGELSVKCRGPSGELSVEIKGLQKELFECSYVPKEEGSHVIDIYWSDIPIPDSPFKVNAIVPTYGNKCTASGDGLKRACVGKMAEFTVDCEQGGVGELQVIIQGQNNKLPAVIEKTKPQTFNVSYTPEEVDAHEIAITWGSEQIPESPFQCTVLDPSKCSARGKGLTDAIINVQQMFVVNTSNAGPGELSVKCRGPSGELPVDIKNVQNESFQCSYVPKEEGSHVIDIYWSDIPIPDSPFKVNAIVPTYADKCTASGDGLKRACVGKRAEFTVDCEQGGVGELQVIIQGQNNKLPAVIEKTKPPQTFNVSYTPEEVDSHEIAITWGSEQIPESPFQCTVLDPSKCSAKGKGLTDAIINVQQMFVVNTSNAGPGELSVKCRGPSGELPVDIKNVQNESFECSYVPKEEGSHVIDIYWSDIPIPDSPFKVNAIVPTYADKCTASGDGLKRACVGKRAEFTVDCEQGGVGELQVIIQGQNNKLPAVIEKTMPQTFNVSYTPQEVDSHEIAISWGSEQISKSPFQCAVIDPSKCSVSGGLTQATVNTPHTFVMDTRNAGPGELSVKCRGPSGELPVEIKDLQNESFECSYVPKEEGSHVIDIYWSDIPISDSPLKVNAIVPTYADKCTASGDGLKRACVGKRAEFTVDCEQSGVGELQVIIQGQNNKLPAVIEKTKPQTFNVSYTPEEVDAHEIAVSWGSEQIPESPFQCSVIDPSKCSVSGGLTQATVNTPHTFVVNTRNAGPGELSVKCRGPSGELPVDIKNVQNESFECSYVPKEEGSHVIDIYWSDIPIADSPFKVNAIVPTYADKCTASGDGLKRACMGKRAEFTVDCEQGGVGELQVIIQGQNNKLPAVIETTMPQTFNVSYTPQEVDSHEIAVSWGNKQISESPFQCSVIDPSKCSVSGGLTQATVNTPHTFVMDTRNAGPGELSVKCRGPSGEIPVDIKDLQKESFECSYVPKEEGSHVIDIYWSDIPIADSPFKINAIVPTYADKCTASGDGLKRACVDKRAEFTVDCEQGGVGELQVIIQGQNNKLPAVIEKTKPQTFNVSYTPEEVDAHEIAVSWGSEQISESPFQCSVIDPSKCSVSGGLTQATVNTPHTFVMDTRNAGPGELSVKCRGPSGELPVEIKYLQKESFECSYVPKEEGSHVIDIYWSDIPIPDSPFKVNAIVPTYADKCTASGDGLKRACVGKRAEFTVDCEQGGVGELQVIIQGQNNKLPAVIEKTKPQTFNVSYTPQEVDSHEIAISWGSEQIPESPFQCAVIDPSKCSVSGGLTQATVNTPHTFVMDTRNAGPGKLSVKCRGPSGDIPVDIKDLQKESFECSYVPKEEGSHVIDIYWSDIPIPDSPFKVNAIVPTYADKCTASGDGLKRACVGKRAEFTVDCEQGGVGELQVIIQGQNNKLPAVIEKTKPQTFNVSYTPEEVDSHEIGISWGSKQIPESPFQCAVIDPSKCSVSGGLTQATVNTPHTFVMDTRNAGPGELSVKCRGPSGDLPVEIKYLQKESFECSYVPKEEGSHVIDIYWSNIPIRDSPFKVNAIVPTYADKCTASGDGLKRACVGKRAEFTVDCEQGGVGELQVIIQGQNNKLPAVIEKTKPQTFNVSYTPEEVDSHEIAISWGSEQISESPFQCAVIDPSKCSVSGGLTQATVNTPHTFVVDTRNAGPGKLSVKCRGPSGELPVEIKDAGNKTFQCTWIPQKMGAHNFDIILSGYPIPTSPLQVNAVIYADPGKCSIYDLPHGDLYMKKTYTFTVKSEQPGYTCDLTVFPTTKESLESCEINGDRSSGVYTVQFVPAEAGKLTMDVKCNGTNILSSPLSFNVIDLSKPIKEQCAFQVMQNIEESVNIPAEFLESEMESTPSNEIPSTDEEMVLEINEPLTLLIDLESDQIGKDITATVTGEKMEPFDVPVVKNSNNSITICVSANEPDRYTIQLKADGEPLPTGPFFVTFIEPIKIKTPSETQTAKWEPKEERIVKVSYKYKRKIINAQVSLSVDSSMADAINTSIAVQEVETAAPIPISFSELDGGMYNVEFMTTNEREYVMVFKYRLKIVPTAQDKHYVLSVIA